MEAIRVFVVDDHPMICQGVAATLAGTRQLKWVGQAGSGQAALRSAPELQPDVMVLDTSLPDMDALAALTALQARLPQTRFLMLGETPDAGEAQRLLAAGAHGVIGKADSPEDFLEAVRQVHLGKAARPASRSARPPRRPPATPRPVAAELTQREHELLTLMAQGRTNQDIAKALTIALPTVKFHVTNILTKLRADNRTEAVLVALRSQLVELQQGSA